MSAQNKHAVKWRHETSKNLSKIIQDEFKSLQSPSNCNSTRKLTCSVKNNCGFGCQAHHLAYCMITAYSTNRTLVIKSEGWVYDKRGYEAYFKPFSNCSVITNPTKQTFGII